jgi:hypothetical protein
MKRIFCLGSSLLFTLFAAFQYNDPDPYIWIMVYMFVALLSVISIFRKLNPYLIVTTIIMYVSGAIYLWPDVYMGITMPMDYKPEIELARESLGLALAALALCGLLAFSLYRKRIPA